MPFCPACRSEYRQGFATCADCGDGLVDVLPVPERLPPDTFSPVLVTTSYARAFLLRGFLEENDIPAEVENEFSWNHVLGIPLMMIPLIVTVADRDLADARAALSAWDVRSTEPAPQTPYWAHAFATALFLGGGWSNVPGRLEPGIMATTAWFSLQAAVLGRLGRIHLWGLLYGSIGIMATASGAALFLKWVPDFQEIPLHHFVVTGPLEETLKILGALLFVRGDVRLRFAGASAVGFATIENLAYIGWMTDHDPLHLFGLRAGSLLHPTLTLFVMAGASARIPGRLIVAAFLHGAWNTMAEADWLWGNIVLFGLIVQMLCSTLRIVARRGTQTAPCAEPVL